MMKDKENSVQAKGADGARLPVAPRSVHLQESAPELTPNPGSQGKQETPTLRVYKVYHVTMISFQDIRKCMLIFPLLKKKSETHRVNFILIKVLNWTNKD